MSLALTLDSELALFGGEPVATHLQSPPWPPVNEATAQQLAGLYLGRNWSFNGPHEQKFAADYAAYHGAKYGVFMANGTVTLQCALGVYGIGAGDEVIMPALTWPATAMAVLYLGATPVFVDIETDTLCLDPAAFEAAITPRTRAVVPVHLYGGMADVEEILRIARKHDLIVIEDCAHAQGGKWDGRGVGSWGDVGSFSFQQSKTMSSGEGGICITNDAEVAERLYRMKHIGYASGAAQGMSDSSPPAGMDCHNFRGTEFQAVILEHQLGGLEELIRTYNCNAAYLTERVADIPGVRVQSRGRLAEPQSYYGFCLIFDEEPMYDIPMNRIIDASSAEGLYLHRTYGCVYNHLLWNVAPDRYKIAHGSCPVAETIGTSHVGLFLHPMLGADAGTIECIGDIIAKVAHNVDRL